MMQSFHPMSPTLGEKLAFARRRTASSVMSTISVPATKLQPSAGRWIVAAAVLGSGAVFLESTVVNVALPALARDLGLGMRGVQWVVNGYLLTLSALMLLGGALGDVYPRARVFALGAIAFGAASAAA